MFRECAIEGGSIFTGPLEGLSISGSFLVSGLYSGTVTISATVPPLCCPGDEPQIVVDYSISCDDSIEVRIDEEFNSCGVTGSSTVLFTFPGTYTKTTTINPTGCCDTLSGLSFDVDFNQQESIRGTIDWRYELCPVGPEQVSFQIQQIQTTELVGTELRKLISWFPVPGKNGCKKCQALEKRMNQWGVEQCEKKIDFIVKKLWVAAKRRKIPFSEKLAKVLVNKAIRNARR